MVIKSFYSNNSLFACLHSQKVANSIGHWADRFKLPSLNLKD